MQSTFFLEQTSAIRSTRTKTFFECYILIAVAHLVLILYPPTTFVYNIDEQQLTFAALDRFLGLPSSCLQWPGSTLQLLFLPLFLLGFLLSVAAHPFAPGLIERWVTYLANSYEYPEARITEMRVVSLLINSFAPILAYVIARKLSRSGTFAAVAALFLALQPMFFRYSVMGLGDAVSITFLLAGLAVQLCSKWESRAQIAAFLYAGALAAKVTIATALFLPLVLLVFGLSDASLRQRIVVVARFLAALMVGFLFWNPYLWVDPIRFVKATVGNALKPGAAFSLSIFARKYFEAMGIPLTLITLIVILAAVGLLVRRRASKQIILALCSAGVVMLPILASATTSEPRYLLPVLPCFLVLAASVYGELAGALAGRWSNKQIAIPLLVLAMLAVAEIFHSERLLRKPDDLFDAVAQIQNLSPQTLVFVPEEAVLTMRLHPTTDAINRIVNQHRAAWQADDGVVDFLQKRRIPLQAAKVLVQNFNDDEQVALRELVARSFHQGPDRPNLFVYRSTLPGELASKRTSLAEMSQQTAIDQARSTGSAAVLVEAPKPELGQAAWTGRSAWALYLF